jgi:hypothetical protein
MTMHPHQPDRRSNQFKKAQREREQAESRHDHLCITVTKSYGMTSCWCKCRLCWDPTYNRCVCVDCPCQAEILLPSLTIPHMQRGE